MSGKVYAISLFLFHAYTIPSNYVSHSALVVAVVPQHKFFFLLFCVAFFHVIVIFVMRKRETEIQLKINVLGELSSVGGVKAHFSRFFLKLI